MTLHRSLFIALAAGLGLLQAGCLAEGPEVAEIGGVGYETLEGGDHGTNGLDTWDLAANEAMLWAATNDGINDLDNFAVAQLQAAPNSETLDYAVRCAVPQGVSGPGNYTGRGHLSTTSDWLDPDGFLALPEKLDLFTCMIAHVNPFNVDVNLMLTGDTISDGGMGPGQVATYNIEEALWIARLDSVNGLEYIVWPLDFLELQCPNTQNALLTRTCGGLQAGGVDTDCRVEVRTGGPRPDCTKNSTTGNWTCLGRPAIKTWLSSISYLTLYPGCYPLAQ
ncbi:hypothetical protein [Polyangium spumosum]|uniref:Lipoprotein n=1 Tax=Polyangium spumosum TaxID=889282 RepID=A0A6N7PU32_9BACT|nr:hypothetical protein [Polyangium spumosum]MRG95429.1 hypothetical protein [Polyangium spumosum]